MHTSYKWMSDQVLNSSYLDLSFWKILEFDEFKKMNIMSKLVKINAEKEKLTGNHFYKTRIFLKLRNYFGFIILFS